MRNRNTMITFWKEPNYAKENVKLAYLVYQKEICPHTKKTHWQGYAEWTDKMSIKQIKEFFKDDTVHIETRKGSQKDAINYCTKLESRDKESIPVTFGKPKEAGHRSDLDSIVEDIESGYTKKELLKKFGGNALRHISMIDKAQLVFLDKDITDTLVITHRQENHHHPLHVYDYECFFCRQEKYGYDPENEYDIRHTHDGH